MDINKEYDLLMSEMLSRAIESFRGTEQYELLQVEIEQFTTEQQDLMISYMVQREKYIYQKGIEDSFLLLQKLGVL